MAEKLNACARVSIEPCFDMINNRSSCSIRTTFADHFSLSSPCRCTVMDRFLNGGGAASVSGERENCVIRYFSEHAASFVFIIKTRYTSKFAYVIDIYRV